jgi:hypothetical protein
VKSDYERSPAVHPSLWRRRRAGLAAALVILVALLVISIMVGSKSISVPVIWEALFDPSR